MHVTDFKIPELPQHIQIMFPEEFYAKYFRTVESMESLEERVPFCYTDDFDKMFLVIKDGEKIVASLTMKTFPKDESFNRPDEIVSMMAIGVDKDYRNQGFAKALIDAFFQISDLNNIKPSHSYWEPDGKKYLENYWDEKYSEFHPDTNQYYGL